MRSREVIREYEIPKTGADLEQVLLLCRPHMDEICEKEPEGGWLSYIFRRLLAEYFPENYTAEMFPGAEQASAYYLKVLNGICLLYTSPSPRD